MVQLSKGTWVVVADAEKALLMENVTDHDDPNFRIISRTDSPAQDTYSDRPGRHADTGHNHKSGLAEHDWHALARDKFAKSLADLLYRYAHKGKFSQLVIAAAPDLLGALRGELHSEVSGKVIAEIPKTLTNHPPRKLEALIKSELDAR